MSVFFSDQQIAALGSGASPPRKLRAVEAGGKVIRALFSATLPPAGLAIGDMIQLCVIPGSTVIVGGMLCWDRGQGAALTSIGTADNPDKYLASTPTVSPDAVRFAETQPQHFATVLTTAEILIATNAAAAWIPQSTITGYVEYIGS